MSTEPSAECFKLPTEIIHLTHATRQMADLENKPFERTKYFKVNLLEKMAAAINPRYEIGSAVNCSHYAHTFAYLVDELYPQYEPKITQAGFDQTGYNGHTITEVTIHHRKVVIDPTFCIAIHFPERGYVSAKEVNELILSGKTIGAECFRSLVDKPDHYSELKKYYIDYPLLYQILDGKLDNLYNPHLYLEIDPLVGDQKSTYAFVCYGTIPTSGKAEFDSGVYDVALPKHHPHTFPFTQIPSDRPNQDCFISRAVTSISKPITKENWQLRRFKRTTFV